MLLKVIRYLWASPNTVIGVPFLILSLFHRKKPQLIDGTLEIENRSISWILTKLIPIRGGAMAITLGHIVIGRDEECLRSCRNHERAHVKQCERWGPFFLPAYFASSCIEYFRNNDPYIDNYFEKDARRVENELRALS